MEAIANENLPIVERYYCRAVAEDGGERVVTHPHAPTRDRIVGDEGRLIRKHVVGRPGVGDQ